MVALTLLAIAACPVPPAEQVVVPMKMRGAMPGLEVTVDGKGPYFFALDTGGSGMARADVSLVKQLSLPVVGKARAMGAGGKPFDMDIVEMASVKIGPFEFTKVQAASRDYNTGVPLPPIKGILGFGLFKDDLLTLDYPKKQITIAKGALPEPDGKSVLGATAGRGGIAHIPIEAGGIKMDADIDSGNLAGALVVPWSMFQEMKFKDEPKEAGKAHGAGGEIAIMRATLDGTIKIGEYTVVDPPITTMTGINRPRAILGAAILQNFALTFDQKKGRLKLEKQGDKSFSVKEVSRGGG